MLLELEHGVQPVAAAAAVGEFDEEVQELTADCVHQKHYQSF